MTHRSIVDHVVALLLRLLGWGSCLGSSELSSLHGSLLQHMLCCCGGIRQLLVSTHCLRSYSCLQHHCISSSYAGVTQLTTPADKAHSAQV